MQTIFYPSEHRVVDTHTEIQNRYIKLVEEQGTDAANKWIVSVSGGFESSYPAQIRFEWENDGTAENYFEISESESFSEVFSEKNADSFFVITNLKVGQKYYYRINGGAVCTFETKDNKFRFIHMDGAINARDLGGINIKQGLIYRGSEVNIERRLTEYGKYIWKNQLKIKTEVTLRKEAINVFDPSYPCDFAVYKYLPYRPYIEAFEEEHIRGIVNIMEFFADEDNYPIYFHCREGADRTGMVAMYLRALLGEDEEDIFIDYDLTSLAAFSHTCPENIYAIGPRDRNNQYFQEFIDKINEYKGSTLNEKIESFLLECGVREQSIANIKKILAK